MSLSNYLLSPLSVFSPTPQALIQGLLLPTSENQLCVSSSPKGLLCFPTSSKDFHFQFCLKKWNCMGCQSHMGKQCVFCKIHLKRQTSGLLGRAACHLLWSSSSGQLWLIWAWRSWDCVCSAHGYYNHHKRSIYHPLLSSRVLILLLVMRQAGASLRVV